MIKTKSSTILFFIFISVNVLGQLHSSTQSIAVRVGGGFQKKGYGEIGLTYREVNQGCTGFVSKGYYAAVEWNPITTKDIYGLKVGYELNPYIFNLAIETKYLTNFNKNDFIITPKIGIGLMGVVNIFYGYNISTCGHPFNKIQNHQFSLICNFDFFTIRDTDSKFYGIEQKIKNNEIKN